MNPLSLIGIIMGILILRPLKGGRFINHGSTLLLLMEEMLQDLERPSYGDFEELWDWEGWRMVKGFRV